MKVCLISTEIFGWGNAGGFGFAMRTVSDVPIVLDRVWNFGWQSIGTRYGGVIDRTIARHRAN